MMFLRSGSRLRFLFGGFRQNHTLIHSEIYPLDDRQSNVYKQLTLNGREEYLSSGCLYLKDFLRKETLSNILDEINSILTNSSNSLFQSSVQHTENLYQTNRSQSNLNEIQTSSKTIIAFDQIPRDSLLRQLYFWDPLADFISDIIRIGPRLYRSCDQLGALYVNVYRQSDQLSWHTDHSQFFVNLLLQQLSLPHEGVFQYKTEENGEIRSRNDFQAGGLVLFNGRKYPHRVTQVRQSTIPRINAILTYDSTPNHHLSEYIIEKFFRPTERNNK